MEIEEALELLNTFQEETPEFLRMTEEEVVEWLDWYLNEEV